jgi:hypothetical protein
VTAVKEERERDRECRKGKRQQQCDPLSMADRIDVEKKRVLKKERIETSAKKSTSNMNSRACVPTNGRRLTELWAFRRGT